jgi:SulP family sulfate permease
MRHINMIDATAMRALEDVIEKASSEKTTLMFSGVSKELMAVLKKSGIDKKIGTENIFPHINDALTAAEYLVRS